MDKNKRKSFSGMPLEKMAGNLSISSSTGLLIDKEFVKEKLETLPQKTPYHLIKKCIKSNLKYVLSYSNPFFPTLIRRSSKNLYIPPESDFD